MKGASIHLHELQLGFPGQPPLCQVNGCFAAGSATAVMGRNGAGKSTLLHTLLTLHPALAGRVVWEGHPPTQAAWLPQLSLAERDFPISVFDTVSLGHWQNRGAFRSWGLSQRRASLDALAQVGLQRLANAPISSLSGGQFQRMLFARLSVQNAPTLLLDEPFNNVDSESQAILLQQMTQWRDQGGTLILVLHDQALARRHFPNQLVLASPQALWCSHTHTPAATTLAMPLRQGA